MHVLVFESNLMWSSRLVMSLKAFGHEATLVGPGKPWPAAEAAIVNLGEAAYKPEELVPALRAQGIKVLAHAGHKEKELIELGRTIGCDRLATNSELTNKLPALMDELAAKA
ncbi:hypothetical protein EON79_17750 [bacterium]|nr:MAG: hypothetical protein EON79_17750 [bacterium]